MNKRTFRGNADAELLIMIGGFALFLVCIYAYFQIKAFAAWAELDIETVFSMIKRFGVLFIVMAFAVWKGWLRVLTPYIPAAIFLCLTPALDFWSWDYIMTGAEDGLFSAKQMLIAQREEQAWFGNQWMQILIGLCLAFFGIYLDIVLRPNS